MKCIQALLCVMILCLAGQGAAQDSFIGSEPPEEHLGASKYPGAVFIRTVDSLDPFFLSVLYVTDASVEDVTGFLAEHLPDARVITYEEEHAYEWAFLLAPWIQLENDPTRNELVVLDSSPNIQVKRYNRRLYDPLIEYFQTHPGFEDQLAAMDNAQTVIRYTQERMEDDSAMEKLIGTWRNVARDLQGYYGTVYKFFPDGAYQLEYTEKNIAFHASRLSSSRRYEGMSEGEIRNELAKHNPETGSFTIMRNTVSMHSDNPVIGGETKSGLATVKTISLTLQLINMPVLTYIRQPD